MENIEKISKIKRETLSDEHYFQSLLEKAYISQLLSEVELEKIQFDCLALLAKKSERFNGGDSSSIRIEKAQDILASIMFTIGVALKAYPNPDDAVCAVQSIGVEAIYTKGRKRIDILVEQTRKQHLLLVSHLMQTNNVFYSSTIVDGIKGFFKLYDADFAAQEIHITADYPIYNKIKRLLGIEFIMQYLKQLYFENMFCTHFSHEDIHHLLCGYDERYENLLLNIYELVLASALGCILADAPANLLEITPEIQSLLYHQFSGKEHPKIKQMLHDALSKLSETLSFSDSLILYVKQSLYQLATAIESAIKAENLERVFIVPKYPEDNPKLIISYGEKMDNELYRKVLTEFMNSESMVDKINIMKNQINSLADLEDLLLDAELNADEIIIILKSLSPAEIVTLMKKYNPSYEMSFTELRNCEKIFCEGLYRFVASLPLEQQVLFAKTVNSLELEGFEQ